MDALYTALLSSLNGLLPTAVQADYANFNELLAYVLTISLIYLFLLKPLLKLVGIIKR